MTNIVRYYAVIQLYNRNIKKAKIQAKLQVYKLL